jgi:CHAT domain-containing protein
LQDPEAAWALLRSGKPITPQQSETFLGLFENRVLTPAPISSADKRVLLNLAHALQQNHHDSWLQDFLNAPLSVEANQFLKSAISNRDSDTNQALRDALAAENLYVQAGNIAGAARSQAEIIYVERRLSRANKCIQEISKLQQRIAQLSYTGFQALVDYESSNCWSMLGDFDLGLQFAERTKAKTEQANYPSLNLRAQGLLSSLASEEGRYQAAFNADASGLELYWKGAYEGKRGFQFYSDAALTARRAGFWHLAAGLQLEALDALGGTDLFNYQAMAHHHRAIALLRAGDPVKAQQELDEAGRLFDKKVHDPFLLAHSGVDLAEIETEQGNISSAQAHLEKAASALGQVDNFVVQLAYYNTLANLARHESRPAEEWKYLEKATEIAKRGFTNLRSVDNRWEWYQEVDRSFHRLIELEIELKNDPAQALADWEAYRAAEVAPSRLAVESRANRDRLLSYTKRMRSSTLISFIVFPERVLILLADDRGVRLFSSLVDAETLKRESETFLRLCSDQTSSLEKVNQDGSRLYKRLLQPIQNELTPDRALAIEADGFLSRIPWPALVAENGKYLDEEYMTVSTPGLFFATPGRSRKKAVTGRLVAYPGGAEFEGKVYPPLPHAREEADDVAGLQPDSKYLREEEVTRDELLQGLPRASSFHFAGHAASREHGGELLLSGKDQVLSASAIRLLDLSGMDLAVLSACSTAEADLDIARSPNGLVQVFLSAGAHEVVASRWDVDSASSLEFMKQFYTSLQKANSSRSAIRIARRFMMEQKSHPYYWSSFATFGAAN